MSDKLKLSKLALIFSLLIITFSWEVKVMVYNSEIICPNGLRVLVKFARREDVVMAIQKAAFIKKKDSSNEGYTVIRLHDKRSLKIERMPPEESLKCLVRESQLGMFTKSYVEQYTGQK